MAVPADAKPSLEAYPQWLREQHATTVDDRMRNRYETVAAAIHRTFVGSEFWTECGRNLRQFDALYRVERGYPLLDSTSAPEIHIKPFSSFVIKTYRKNISENRAWPDPPPRTGWVIPLGGLPSIGDVVRTTFVAKYLDGVSFLVERLGELAATHGIRYGADYEAREEGYYAAHAYVLRSFEVPAAEWDTEKLDMSIELQITTQVQELIKKLLHTHYDKRRTAVGPSEEKWQWDYRSDEFAANYLGHILHYVEGMIMEIRDKQSANGSAHA